MRRTPARGRQLALPNTRLQGIARVRFTARRKTSEAAHRAESGAAETHNFLPKIVTARSIDDQCTTDIQLLSSIATALINIEGGVHGGYLLAPALHPDGQLLTLGARLKEVDATKESCPGDDEDTYTVLHQEHWRLREKINEIEATTIEGLRVKAQAADFAFKDDSSAECEGPGSFIALSQSINQELQSERLSARSELDC